MKLISRITNICSIVLITFFTSVAHADIADLLDDPGCNDGSCTGINTPHIMYPFYIGTDLTYTWAKPNDDYYKVLRSHEVGSNVFVGYRFNIWQTPWCCLFDKDFGIELGLHWTNRKKKYHTFYPGDTFFAFTNNTAVPIEIDGRVRIKTSYIDFKYYQRINCYELTPIIGLGWGRPSVHLYPSSVDPDFVDSQLKLITLRARFFWRFGLGIERVYYDRLGFRANVLFETYRMLGIRQYSVPQVNGHPLKDGVTIGIGAFYLFGWDRSPCV